MNSFFYLKIKSIYNINRMATQTFTSPNNLLYENRKRFVKGSAFTHTCTKGGAYYIQSEYTDQFHKLYTNDLLNNKDLFITEKHSDISPVLIDFDLRFNKDETERKYTSIDLIDKIVVGYIDKIKSYVELPEKVEVYVMEKSKPVYDEKKNLVKDGFHIMMPNIVTRPSVQLLVRKELLERYNELMINGGSINIIDDIFDECVIDKNNWILYGSKKPGGEAYKVTHHWSTSPDGEKTENELLEIDTDYIKTLSIRNKYTETIIKPEHKDAINVLDREHKAKELNIIKIKDNLNKTVLTDNDNNFKLKTDAEDIELAKKIVKILDKKRAENYVDWIKVGWCLRNIHIELLEDWEEFSKQSEKYEKGCFDNVWFRMTEGTLNMGTLHYWAKNDNPEKYDHIIKQRNQNTISYSGVRKIFEEKCFKINNPVSFGEINVFGTVVVRTKKEFKDRFEEIKFEKEVMRGKDRVIETTQFIKEWFLDSTKRVYEKIDFVPPPIKIDPRIFNTWEKFEVEKLIDEGVDESTEIEAILYHIKVLCNFDERAYDYFLKWLAQIVQNPATPCGTMPVLVSDEGGGKGSLLKLLRYI
jgi:hypothetical protein